MRVAYVWSGKELMHLVSFNVKPFGGFWYWQKKSTKTGTIFKSLFQKFSLLDLQNVYVCALESIQHLSFKLDIQTRIFKGRPLVPLYWDKKVSFSRCPFVLGQKEILVPVSFCPGTRAGSKIPGQTPLSWDKINT